MPGRLNRIVTAVLVLVIVGAAGTAAYVIAAPDTGEKYTEFYFARPGPQKEEPPRIVTPGEVVSEPLGIVNYEGKMTAYRIEVVNDGKNVAQIEPIVLEYGQSWHEIVTFVLSEPAGNHKVEFLLYTGEATEPYRQLNLWVGVQEK